MLKPAFFLFIAGFLFFTINPVSAQLPEESTGFYIFHLPSYSFAQNVMTRTDAGLNDEVKRSAFNMGTGMTLGWLSAPIGKGNIGFHLGGSVDGDVNIGFTSSKSVKNANPDGGLQVGGVFNIGVFGGVRIADKAIIGARLYYNGNKEDTRYMYKDNPWIIAAAAVVSRYYFEMGFAGPQARNEYTNFTMRAGTAFKLTKNGTNEYIGICYQKWTNNGVTNYGAVNKESAYNLGITLGFILN